MNYAIPRVQRLKSVSAIKASQAHCNRTRETKNADPDRTPSNRQLLGNIETLLEQIQVILDATTQKRKIRSDANLAGEILFTASPTWYRKQNSLNEEIDLEKVDQFSEGVTQFLQQEFGPYCVSAVLHLDEITPHIHAHIVPVHRETGWLSWDDLFGGPEKLRQFHDRYAKFMEPLGLVRGVRGTIADHETMQNFYGRIQREIPAPDLEKALSLPVPEINESVSDYHQRVSTFLAAQLLPVQDEIDTLVAHARNESFALRKEKETRVTLHALSQRVEELERQQVVSQGQLTNLSEAQKTATAQEMILTTNMTLNLLQRNYWKGQQYIFSRRRGYTRIDRRQDGERLVHNQDGKPELTQHFTLSDAAKIRSDRDKVLLSLSQQYEGWERKGTKRR